MPYTIIGLTVIGQTKKSFEQVLAWGWFCNKGWMIAAMILSLTLTCIQLILPLNACICMTHIVNMLSISDDAYIFTMMQQLYYKHDT